MTNSPCTPENQALADAYQAMRGNLLGWMASKVNNPADAEDLLQEVMHKAVSLSFVRLQQTQQQRF